MSFGKGMRRVSVAFGAAASLIVFVFIAGEYKWSAAGMGYAFGTMLVWILIYAIFVAIVRWIWLGFVERDSGADRS